jgi:MoxR-like ATPase
MRVSFGYPTGDEEWRILVNRMARQREEVTLDAVVGPDELLEMQAAVERVVVDESIGRYCVALTAATRTHTDVLMGASPRGALGLLLSARAYAIIDGRDYVTPEDVKAVARPVLAHRVTVKPELWMSDVSGGNIVTRLLRSVPTPPAREAAGPAGRTLTAGASEA